MATPVTAFRSVSKLMENPNISRKKNVPIKDTGNHRDKRRTEILQEDVNHKEHQQQRYYEVFTTSSIDA